MLLSFVEIVEREARLEVWVQVVVDLLGLAQFDPLFGQLVELTQNADGIRLAEQVHILELPPLHIHFNL